MSVLVEMNGQPTDVTFSFDNLQFTILDDYPVEKISDLLDYTYYVQANMIGEMKCDAIRLTSKTGHSKTEYEFPTAEFWAYAKDGDIYLDLSAIDLSDLGIEENKYCFKDGFSFLKEERFTDLRNILAIPDLDMQGLLAASTENVIIENAIHMERYDTERYQVRFDLTSDSISQVAGYFGETTPEEAKATIDQYVVLDEGTYLSALYNMKENSISGLGVKGTIGIPLEPIEYEGVTIDLSKTRANIDVDMEWEDYPAFEIPALEGYKEYVIEPEEETSSEESVSQSE